LQVAPILRLTAERSAAKDDNPHNESIALGLLTVLDILMFTQFRRIHTRTLKSDSDQLALNKSEDSRSMVKSNSRFTISYA
jgi:hypothetical protein